MDQEYSLAVHYKLIYRTIIFLEAHVDFLLGLLALNPEDAWFGQTVFFKLIMMKSNLKTQF